MNAKFLICLTSCLFLNGSFAPIGEGKESANVDKQVNSYSYRETIEDSIKYQIAVLENLTKHENELRLALHNAKVTRDSLSLYTKNIKP